VSGKVDLSEFVSGFLAESDDLMALANSSLLAAETAAKGGGQSPRAVREAFRALHTIKGLSSMVGVEPVVALAHRMEALLRLADQGATRLTPQSVDLLLQGVRAIEQRITALREGKPVADAPAGLLLRMEAIEAGPLAPQAAPPSQLELEPSLLAKLQPMDRDQLLEGIGKGKHALRADFTPSPEKAAAGVSITSVRERLKAHVEIVKVLPLSVPATASAPGGLSFVLFLLAEVAPAALAALLPEAELAVTAMAAAPLPVEPEEEGPDEGPGARTGLVRVEVARLDDAMEKLSALIVTRHRLARAVTELAATGSNVRALKQILSENARQLRELRAAVLSVRMVRMAEVLERVPLLVRGLRRNTGKQVKLVLDTGDAEVDKAVADRLFPAIVHLVRNAVDHAIESPAARRTLGKPEEGVLRIACRQRGGNQLELSIEDDGSGVDRELVARRAKREVPDTDAGLLELLCLPGLSTRSEATTTSGRGMGMDIVRRVAEDELGGELLMHTAPGVGTTFTLRVPLTITIVDAFTFECADQRYVVPVSTVEEIVELDAARLTRTPGAVSRASLIQRRGEALPVLQLAALFGLPQQAEATRALVIRRGGEATGFAVHRMLGQQEVVVRPMQDSLVRVTGITGATDLGDGRPTLVLDLAAIAGVALGKEAA
jgi:two-component system chemotaxis sensor kinase CheA